MFLILLVPESFHIFLPNLQLPHPHFTATVWNIFLLNFLSWIPDKQYLKFPTVIWAHTVNLKITTILQKSLCNILWDYPRYNHNFLVVFTYLLQLHLIVCLLQKKWGLSSSSHKKKGLYLAMQFLHQIIEKLYLF